MMKDLNIVEQKKFGKWLAKKLGKDSSTVSKWYANKMPPPLEILVNTAKH